MGRPKIGVRASTFLKEEAVTFIDNLAMDLGIKTRSSMMRLLLEYTTEVVNIKEIMEVKTGKITDAEFMSRRSVRCESE